MDEAGHTDGRGNPVTGGRTGVAESGGKRRVLVHASGFLVIDGFAADEATGFTSR
ncbi:hypothetical protein [Nostocoides australiense]